MTGTQINRLTGLASDVAMKAPCRVATTANITLSGTQTIDSVAVVADDRVLVKNQTTTTENGIYDVAAGAWTRADDFNGPRDTKTGTIVFVTAGTTYADTLWRISTSGDPEPGEAMAFTQVSVVGATGPAGATGATGAAGSLPIVTAGGSADAITADYTPNLTLANLTLAIVVAGAANTTTTPTFAPDGLTAYTITKLGGTALAVGDIAAAGHVLFLEYNSAGTRWELLNPATTLGGAKLAGGNAFTGAQTGGVTALTSSAASIAINMALNNDFTHTFTENTTLANPTNIVAGQKGRIFFTQHASSPKTLAFGSYYKFAAGSVPSVTATNSALDVLYYDVLSATQIACNLVKAFA